MLASQSLMLAPHGLRMPLWMLLVCLAVLGFTLARIQGYVKLPSKWVAIASVFLGWGLLWREYGSPMVVEFWVDLLLFMYTAKLLELAAKRDVSQIMLLSFFVAMTHFLFSESMLQTAVTFFGLLMVMATLIAIHMSSTQTQGRQPLKLAGIAFLQALPLLVILFVFFPRLSPFWTIPLEKGTAVTGLSDRLMLGDIHRLVQSDALAFRVNFAEAPPPSRDLYWRTLVLSEYSGGGWIVGSPPKPRAQAWDYTEAIDYQLLTQPMRVPFIPSLDRILSVTGESVRLDQLGFVRSTGALQTVSQYQMRSGLNSVNLTELTDAEQAAYLALPGTANPLARAYGASLGETHKAPDAVIQAVLDWYFDQFTYTLNPGGSDGDPIDHFLFEAQRGFCEHFAAGFTLIMRAAGVPARVVLGYQGGTYNASGNYIEVRQFDAHAWSEVWVDGEGWRRVDPTAVIAPERIESGMGMAAAGMDGLMTGKAWDYFQMQSLGWLYNLQLEMQALSHLWDRVVVNYDQAQQIRWLSAVWPDLEFEDLAPIALAGFLLGLGVITFGLVAPPRWQRLSQEARWWRGYRHCLEAIALGQTGPGRSVEVCQQAWRLARPAEAALASDFVEKFVLLLYQEDETVSPRSVSKALLVLKVRLAWMRFLGR
ncbi:MAG: transglutaminase-like putative cysteine protease [Candidatus Azotimanducaceae bacterium]|jgi:transglutaminase-like putative cysteine protease|tara:strand:+ start:9544 stop:11496 length:1953 start_codon:yes stop_codon:yes gene_type:complete